MTAKAHQKGISCNQPPVLVHVLWDVPPPTVTPCRGQSSISQQVWMVSSSSMQAIHGINLSRIG